MSSASDPAPDQDDPGEGGEAVPGAPADPDEAWRAIVANYGERADLGDALTGLDDLGQEPTGGAEATAIAAETDAAARLRSLFAPWQRPPGADGAVPRPGHRAAAAGQEGSDLARTPEARFVPPVPPAPPRPRADRRAAWLGALGSPLLLLVALLLGIDLPRLVSLALVAGFVVGFCYLVLTMSREPRDPGDDGARV